MNQNRIVLACAALLGVLAHGSLGHAQAIQPFMTQAAAGHPNDNKSALSAFAIHDGTVCMDYGEEWAVPVLAPVNATNAVTRTVYGRAYGIGATVHSVYSFDSNGYYYSGSALGGIVGGTWVSTTITVPARGSLMVKGIAEQSSNQLCMVAYYVN